MGHSKWLSHEEEIIICDEAGAVGEGARTDGQLGGGPIGFPDDALQADNLCLACIEKRLGRPIAIGDVITFPVVEGYPMSDTLHARLFPSKKRRKARASKAVEKGAQ